MADDKKKPGKGAMSIMLALGGPKSKSAVKDEESEVDDDALEADQDSSQEDEGSEDEQLAGQSVLDALEARDPVQVFKAIKALMEV